MTVQCHEYAILTRAACKAEELRSILREGPYDSVLEHLSLLHKTQIGDYRIAFPDRGTRPFSLSGKELVEAVAAWKLTPDAFEA